MSPLNHDTTPATGLVSACWLVLGPIEASYPWLGAGRGAPMIALRLVGLDPAAGAVEWLRYHEVRAEAALVFSADGGKADHRDWPTPQPVWTGLPFDVRTDAVGTEQLGLGLFAHRPQPAFLVTEEIVGDEARHHVYCCSRIRQSGLLFSRLATVPATAGYGVTESIQRACREQPVLWARFTDEALQTTRFEDDVEIEQKLTLDGEVPIWEVACRLAEAVQQRRFDDFLPDLGNEMQRWRYEQDTFEVSGEGGQQGYVAFMMAADGAMVVKYKFFAEDVLRRVERFDEGVTLRPEQYEAYLRDKLGEVTLRRLPHLTRIRFDVNVESARAGHFFGLEVDEVRTEAGVLRQLEIEYHKSRAAFGVRADSIEPELFRLSGIAQRLLTEWEIPFTAGYLSKLSFLRQVADGA